MVTFIVGAAVFFTVDAFIASKSSYDLRKYFWTFPTTEENVFRVEVLASQWMWTFRYPGPDAQFNTDDDVVTNHQLYIPANRKVELRLTSRDVIHSFYIPNIRNKVDAMPGRISRIWFEATKTGTFEIACAEMCGTHHYKMKAHLYVLAPEDFDAWSNEAQKIAQFSLDAENRDNYWGWPWENKQ